MKEIPKRPVSIPKRITRCATGNFTDDELIRRAWDREEIKKLMAKRTFYNANERRQEELNDLWVQEAEHKTSACYGSNWGYYVGMDAIRGYYVDKRQLELKKDWKLWCDAEPAMIEMEEGVGFGHAQLHPVSTHLVEIADDGETAKGIFYSVGYEIAGRPKGKSEALWYCETVAADFIRESVGWRLWHLIITNDFVLTPGEKYSDQKLEFEPGEHPCEREFGTPTISMKVHDPKFQWADGYPFLPDKYNSFTSDISYGPEGHPNRNIKGGYFK